MATQLIHAINAATATTTSVAIPIDDAEKITLQFKRSSHGSGSTAFTVTVSVDGTTFVAFNQLLSNVTNTNSQTPVRVASVSLSSNTSELYSMDLENNVFQFMKVTATETTDGTHDAYVLIEY